MSKLINYLLYIFTNESTYKEQLVSFKFFFTTEDILYTDILVIELYLKD